MIVVGDNVSHLLCKCMAAQAGGGPVNLRPLILDRGGVMTFYFVLQGAPDNVLGVVERKYRDIDVIKDEIREAHNKWGFPTADMLEECFPHGRLVAKRSIHGQ